MNQSNHTPALQQLKNQSLHEQIVDIIRQAILNGDMKPGEALVETELSLQLGVSRAPVREALRILNTEGLVDSVPYHGTTVRSLKKRDIEELYSMRITLETFAVRQVIAQENREHITKLRAFCSDMEDAGHEENIKLVNHTDRVFHDALIAMSNHKLLQSMWQMVAMRIRQVMALRNRRFTDLTQIARNHIPIVDAIEAKDEAEAIDLLAEHIASVGDLIVEDWIDDDEMKS